MTPYELRFEIFKQAYNMLSDAYHVKFAEATEKNGGKLPKDWNEKYPTLTEVLYRASDIDKFVSKETK